MSEYAPGIMLKGERGLSEPVIPGDPSGRTADSMAMLGPCPLSLL